MVEKKRSYKTFQYLVARIAFVWTRLRVAQHHTIREARGFDAMTLTLVLLHLRHKELICVGLNSHTTEAEVG